MFQTFNMFTPHLILNIFPIGSMPLQDQRLQKCKLVKLNVDSLHIYTCINHLFDGGWFWDLGIIIGYRHFPDLSTPDRMQVAFCLFANKLRKKKKKNQRIFRVNLIFNYQRIKVFFSLNFEKHSRMSILGRPVHAFFGFP